MSRPRQGTNEEPKWNFVVQSLAKPGRENDAMGQVTYDEDATRVEFSPEQRVIKIDRHDAQPIVLENPNKPQPKPELNLWVTVGVPIAVALIGLYGAIYQVRRKK